MTAAVLLVLSGGAIAYVMFGYPILLGWVSKRGKRPVIRKPLEPSVSAIIAVHNGEAYLEEKLRSILASDYPREKVEILVASDGSTDRTEAIAAAYAGEGVRLLSLPRGGKPSALNAAIGAARGEILLLTDVRQVLRPDSIRLLMESFADPQVGVVSGEVRIGSGNSEAEANISRYRDIENWIRDRLSDLDSAFGATGALYAMRRSLAVPIPAHTLLDDMYLPLAAFRRGYRLLFDRRVVVYDIPTSLEAEFRRKVRTLAGNYQILRAYPWLLGPENRLWWHFMSYKFARLLLPWLLIVFALSSPWVPVPLNWLAVGGQVVVYGSAAADPWVPAAHPWKKISASARTFVTMMMATLRGLSVFFVKPQSLWK